MKNNRILAAVLVVSILTAGGAYVWHEGRPIKELRVGSDVGGDVAEDVSPALSSPIPEPRQTAVLPSEDTPFRLVVDELRRRSAAGDAAAACRLAAEHLYCSQVAPRRAALDYWLTQQSWILEKADAGPNSVALGKSMEKEMEFAIKGLAGVTSHCQGVEQPSASQIAKLWRASALAGNPSALRQYASGDAFSRAQTLDSLSELATYREEAERIATVSGSRGDINMLLSLAAGYHPTEFEPRSLLGQALERDAARALATYRHIDTALRLHGQDKLRVGREVRHRIEQLEQGLPPTELARADDIALEEIAKWRAPDLRGVKLLSPGGDQPNVDNRAVCKH